MSKPIGYVLDESTPSVVRFVSNEPPLLGDYVLVSYGDGLQVLGMIEWVGARNTAFSVMNGVNDPTVISRLLKGRIGDNFFEGKIKLIGDITRFELPRVPPPPGSPIYQAPPHVLEKVFGGSEPRMIRVGVLLSRPEVPVYVDVNKLVTRHLAILAVTGAGKSNTVAVIADRIVRIGGTVLIFDFHGEYVGSTIGGKVNIIDAKLNPELLTIAELMVLLGIEHRFYNQERVLRRAYAKTMESREGSFIDRLIKAVESLKGREDPKAVVAVLNKIESLREKYRDILDDNVVDVVSRIKYGYANIVDLSRVDEEAADVVVSHFLRRILYERKKYKRLGEGLAVPVLVFVEEAHILAPKDRTTLSKYWMARIAREGRKFGIGLAIVSQRPKSLDVDILSQMNNKIILKIVEPSDQRYIREASETLSEDLAEQLASLNVGEAILIGPFVRVPALVKIDKFQGRLGGADPDIVNEWRSTSSEEYDMIDEMVETVIRRFAQ
ncbi:MAG TPA: ATP-binding protein [Pyrodictium sp.]|nr:ATP-binding protein [Pyrodictium sp.]HIQ55221.1 ATP-binding protein [Pyrodictium sp.]